MRLIKGDKTMNKAAICKAWPVLAIACTFFLNTPAAAATAKSDAPALQGEVSSTREGKMEGVVISAQKRGTPITISVISDDKGRFQFPRAKLSAGDYDVRVRAIGFDAVSKNLSVKVAEKQTAQLNIRLQKTADLAAQMTNAEWMVSVPGDDRDKRALLNCVNCHTLERIMRSKYSADEFINVVLPRMQSYVNQSVPGAPQIRKAARTMEEQGDQRVQIYKELGTFLANINLNNRTTWSYPLINFSRPKGAATRAIYTEYDLPNKLIQPHDVVLDNEKHIWYSSFGYQKIGRVDQATGAVKEFEVPIAKPDFPTGVLALRNDREGMLWIGNMYQASIARFDTKAEQFKIFVPPKEDNLPSTQLNQVSPMNAGVDGKVWAQNSGFAGVHRFDLTTGKVETWAPFKDSKKPHNIYDVISDSKNNAFFTDFRNEQIGRIDAKTGEIKLFDIPTKLASPRRGSMDDQDRLWFGEYRGHKIGMLDTKTEQFREWTVPTPYSASYDVVLDKNQQAWTGSMTTDRIARLDTPTGQFTEYLLPRSTNVRRVWVDNTTTPATFWVGNNHGASILKLETTQ
jgi:streptogramin lyase